MKFTLSYPVQPYVVTQKFGEVVNLAYYKARGINFKGHNGQDLAAYHGKPIYAAHDGIAYWEQDGSAGCGVVVCSEESYDFNGILAKAKTIYWHMADPIKEPKFRSPIYGNVPVRVKRGDLLGYADNTGVSTGDHLHWGFKLGRPNEPDAQFINLEPDNGYTGASDPAPYCDGTYAVDAITFRVNLSLGDFNPDVTKLQKFLIAQNLLTTGIFGFFGPKTKQAVIQFQAQNGIAATGYVGPITRALLNNLAKA